jgi:hypothetical protein
VALLAEVGDDADVEEVGDARDDRGEEAIVIWFILAILMTDGGHLDG